MARSNSNIRTIDVVCVCYIRAYEVGMMTTAKLNEAVARRRGWKLLKGYWLRGGALALARKSNVGPEELYAWSITNPNVSSDCPAYATDRTLAGELIEALRADGVFKTWTTMAQHLTLSQPMDWQEALCRLLLSVEGTEGGEG